MHIFLDFDGTLVDISKRHYTVYTRCVAMLDGNPLNIETYWEFKRKNTKWNKLLPMSGIDPAHENKFLSHFIQLIEDPEMLKLDMPFSDSLEVLDALSKQHQLILVSLRRQHDTLINQVDMLGFNVFFERILSGHSETNEGVLLKKAEVIRKTVNFKDGIVIGDTEADISAAKQLDIPAIAMTTGIRDHDFLSSYAPEYIAGSMIDAKSIIDQRIG